MLRPPCRAARALAPVDGRLLLAGVAPRVEEAVADVPRRARALDVEELLEARGERVAPGQLRECSARVERVLRVGPLLHLGALAVLEPAVRVGDRRRRAASSTCIAARRRGIRQRGAPRSRRAARALGAALAADAGDGADATADAGGEAWPPSPQRERADESETEGSGGSASRCRDDSGRAAQHVERSRGVGYRLRRLQNPLEREARPRADVPAAPVGAAAADAADDARAAVPARARAQALVAALGVRARARHGRRRLRAARVRSRALAGRVARPRVAARRASRSASSSRRGGRRARSRRRTPKTRVRFYVMTYALKNLYQGMLFFLLPFYWKSTTLDAANGWFVILLGRVRGRLDARHRLRPRAHALALAGVDVPRASRSSAA